MRAKGNHALTGALVLTGMLAVAAAACSGSQATDAPGRRPTPLSTPTAVPAPTSETATSPEHAVASPPALTRVATDHAGTTPTPTTSDADLSAPAARVVQLAREDLARRLGIPPQTIGLLSIEAVQWRDASLGCPRPNAKYVQVITPGFRLALEAEGHRYEYHTDTAGTVVWCDQGMPPLRLAATQRGKGQGKTRTPAGQHGKAGRDGSASHAEHLTQGAGRW
jgi:hypothetical protein